MKKNTKILLIVLAVITVVSVVITVITILVASVIYFSSKRIDQESTDSEMSEVLEQLDDDDSPGPIAEPLSGDVNAIFLHHSTGGCIWDGGVSEYFDDYNNQNNTDYQIAEMEYPAGDYGWENNPYDYWNIWVNNSEQPEYLGQQTLDTLTADYDVIIWKHCFPVGYIEEDSGSGDVTSTDKTVINYQLQYNALKQKMYEYPDTRFIVWTAAAMIQAETNNTYAERTTEFVNWVKNTWDEPGDNVYVFDFYGLETEGELYMKDEYADGDSHPNDTFSATVAPEFAQKVIDVIEGKTE